MLTARSFGKSLPAADNSTAAGRQVNRRVELVVFGDINRRRNRQRLGRQFTYRNRLGFRNCPAAMWVRSSETRQSREWRNKMQEKVIQMSGASCLLAGLGTGLAVGILFAPRSGEESRHVIREKVREGRNLLKNTLDGGQDYIKRRGTELVDQANELVDRGARTVTRQKGRISGAVRTGIEAYRSTVDTAEAFQART